MANRSCPLDRLGDPRDDRRGLPDRRVQEALPMDQVSGIEPPCDHLYAEAQRDARYGCVEWGGPCRRTSEATRRARYLWDREAAVAGERRRDFCMSLGDFWDNQVPDEWRIEALNVIRQCRNLDWLILTKRPQTFARYCRRIGGHRDGRTSG